MWLRRWESLRMKSPLLLAPTRTWASRRRRQTWRGCSRATWEGRRQYRSMTCRTPAWQMHSRDQRWTKLFSRLWINRYCVCVCVCACVHVGHVCVSGEGGRERENQDSAVWSEFLVHIIHVCSLCVLCFFSVLLLLVLGAMHCLWWTKSHRLLDKHCNPSPEWHADFKLIALRSLQWSTLTLNAPSAIGLWPAAELQPDLHPERSANLWSAQPAVAAAAERSADHAALLGPFEHRPQRPPQHGHSDRRSQRTPDQPDPAPAADRFWTEHPATEPVHLSGQSRPKKQSLSREK